jgi:hypothetical protein
MSPPDLNSLPPSRSNTTSSPMQPRAMHSVVSPPERHDSPSPRLGSTSLAAAATLNAADISRRSSASNRGSPRQSRVASERRRSQVAMNLNLNDPAIPSPGELSSSDRRASQSYSSMSPATLGGRGTIATGDPHHQRQTSLGEIHNELEQEQEAQVNRMLQMIREQQMQLDSMRASQDEHHSRRSSQQNSISVTNPHAGAAVDDLTPASERSISFPSIHPAIPAGVSAPRRISRNPSSANRSPALRPLPGHESSISSSIEWPPSPLETARRNSIRDESTYYQAETATLTRENQMLRLRIRELEKQVSELSEIPANTPATPSNLVTSPPLDAEPAVSTTSAGATGAPA